MVGLKEAEMMMPLKIGDCTAFLSPSERPTIQDTPDRATASGYLIPVESQRKVSTILPSGASFYRPKGQIRSLDQSTLEFGSSRQLDFELELAFVVGRSSKLGESIPLDEAEDYIFGMVLFNDWTARDIQDHTGSFLSNSSKSFASGISLWVVTLDAMEYFRVPLPIQDRELMPYLQNKGNGGFDIQLEAYLKYGKGTEQLLCQTNFRHAMWTASQLLAQQTINGSNVEIGDIIASGAVSNLDEGHYSSMLELTKAGPVTLEDGSIREFVHDGDTVIVKGYSDKDGIRIGFGEMMAKVLNQK